MMILISSGTVTPRTQRYKIHLSHMKYLTLILSREVIPVIRSPSMPSGAASVVYDDKNLFNEYMNYLQYGHSPTLSFLWQQKDPGDSDCFSDSCICTSWSSMDG